MRPAALLAGLVLVGATSWGGSTATAAAESRQRVGPPVGGVPVVYAAPVPGRVVAPFEAPSTPYARGHRGVDLAVTPGEQVAAAAAGTVGFAGTVAGTRWISIQHPDAIRTTYGPMDRIDVRVGDRVARGQRIGTSAPGHGPGRDPASLHWSARLGPDRYLDPLTLLRGQTGPWRPTLVGAGEWSTSGEPDVPTYDEWTGQHSWWGAVPGSRAADGPGWVFAPNPNLAVGVAGFNSHTGATAMDLTHLGYAPEDVTHFSYAGVDAHGRPMPYETHDTLVGVHEAALRLRDQLRALAAADPGRAIDLVGHSMGGVVALWYLLALHDPADPTLPPVAHVVTIASPIEGAALAGTAQRAQRNPLVDLIVDHLAGHVSDSASLEDLAPGSALLSELEQRWARARGDPWTSPLATGTRVATFGGSRDPVVPEHRSELPDAPHVVLPGDHSRVRDTEASRIAVRAFLADQPVPGAPGGVGHVVSYGISWLEGLVGELLAPPLPIPGFG